eukprot:TRINITY_DN14869_c0_g1_i1.p1 TRINITY_DN14869_c0_g1~~TRINITY_DN14869_c0_g1_i1.p1  ORF type:complete len:231 (-),score=3.85 TRINITY_DN14869_c0_g1_i1:36-728(-)
MVIILGDDPGANSSQNEQDNLHFAKMAYMPVLEPSTPQEAYEFFLKAASISVDMNSPVILRMTTHVCHAKEKVYFNKYVQKTTGGKCEFSPGKNGNYIPITSRVFPLKLKALEKLKEFVKHSEKDEFNILIDNGNKSKGVICFGMPYLSILDACKNSISKPDILKVGFPFPLPEKEIIEFLKNHDSVKIIEELDDHIIKDIKAIAFDNGCLLYTSPSPRDRQKSRMPSSA